MNGRRKAALMVAAAFCLTASGCSTGEPLVPSPGLARLAALMPGPGFQRGGYQITAVFSDALNLPAWAKVRLLGADVGQLDTLAARNYTAVAKLRIMEGVRLPKGTTAELRSATPLGDVFISVTPPAGAGPDAPLMKDGDTIPVERTSAAATVEAMLTGAALVVNGGAIKNLTDIINGAGKATGDQGHALGELLDDSNRLLVKLNARTDQIATSLTELSTMAGKLDQKNYVVSDVLAAAAPATQVLAKHTAQIADLIETAGATTEMLAKFPSIAGTDTSGRSAIRDLNELAGSFNDVVVHPDARLNPILRMLPPIIKDAADNSIAVDAAIDQLAVGRIPDIGFPGDVGVSPLKWYHLQQIFGSLKYEFWRYQERIVGRGPDVPQVPVIPSPTEVGQWQPQGPPPGPTLPGQFVDPPGYSPPGPFLMPVPAPAPAPAMEAAP